MSGTLIPNMPFADYLADKSYGSSAVNGARGDNMAALRYDLDHDSPDTSATIVGTAAHAKILDPETYTRELFYEKGIDEKFLSKEDKARRDGMLGRGIKILTYGESCAVNAVRTAVLGHPVAGPFIQQAKTEVSCFWVCPETGIKLKCRADAHTDTVVADLKVGVAGTYNLKRMRSAAYWSGWVHQLAHNREGLRANGIDVKEGGIILVPTTPPVLERIHCLQYTEDDLDGVMAHPKDGVIAARRKIAYCDEHRDWSDRQQREWIRIGVPSVSFDDEEDV